MVQKKGAAGMNGGAPRRMCIRGTLASGRKVSLGELTGSDEIAAAQEAEQNQALLVMCQILRSLIEVDGKKWDPSMHTALSLRDEFSSKDWRMMMEMHGELNLPTVEESNSFRAGWERYGADEEGDTA